MTLKNYRLQVRKVKKKREFSPIRATINTILGLALVTSAANVFKKL